MHMHHDHVHEHHHSETPMEELVVLMKYMVGHNAEHTHELSHLAEDIKEAGNEEICNEIMRAVECYNQGNDILASALSKIKE